MKKLPLRAACCSALLCAVSAIAQSPSDSTVVELANIDVAANRAGTKTPVAFTSIPKAAIEAANDSRDVPYLLGMTPSLIMTSDAGGGVGYTSLRLRGSDASRINVSANGIPLNDAESHRVYWVNMPDIAASVRDIQIQRGAGTSTSGAGAFGGSINMLTDAPAFEPYAVFQASYGAYNTNKESLRVGSGLLGGRWSADLRLTHASSDGYIDRAFSKFWSYFGQIAYNHHNTSVRMIAFGGREQTYHAWYYASREEMEQFGRRYNPAGQYINSDGEIAYYPNQTDNYRQHNFQLHWSQMFDHQWNLHVAAHYTRGDGYYEQYERDCSLEAYGLRPFEDQGKLVYTQDLIRDMALSNDFGGVVANLSKKFNRVDFTAGGGVNHYDGRHFGNIIWVRNYIGPINPDQEFFRHKGVKTDGNIFARANWDIGHGFSAYADLQWRSIDYKIQGKSDTFDSATGQLLQLDIVRRYSFFNPKVGANFSSADMRHRAFASWSVAHKEPTHDDFTDADPAHLPKAERMFDFEAGYTFNLPVLSLGLNLYRMDYRDQLVVTGQLSDVGNQMRVNVPDSYRMGLEFQGALRPARWFEWNLNATLSRNRIKNFTEYIYSADGTNPIAIDCGSTPIAFSPSFTLNNSFAFRWRGLDASLESHYVSKQYMTNARVESQTLSPYFVSDLRLSWTFRNLLRIKELRLGVAVYNVFNATYENNGYAGSFYILSPSGAPEIYRYSGYAAQAPAHLMTYITVKL